MHWKKTVSGTNVDYLAPVVGYSLRQEVTDAR
ncbi:hypothetical protein VNG_2544H [Halobacterium salinarum NRC-1]|uniref:Uncharacterized protein n=2 Tax=Halobacterium salinarum NRC-34001 TaxID=2886895 RepID=Q9HMH1_HALSA|nr:hypothetical protein VNG_2544H [Halobacterium salinarum NRC-1]CAP14908.1 uncharacterized protein OE_4569R [Halobacterium salinarum R1]DAC79364.1 TPA_inf: uncharacterized protein VNG_2544H [Halobacterium salinarum NRC-1]